MPTPQGCPGVRNVLDVDVGKNSPDVADLSRRKLSSYLSVVRRMCRVNILANVAIFEISDVNSSQAEVLANPLALVDVTQCNM